MRLRACAAAAILAAIGAWACGGSGPGPSNLPPGSTTVTIAIVGVNGSQSFSPNPASFGGRMVVFKNNDTSVHRVVLNDGSIDTGDIPPGGSSQPVLMPAQGTNYHCSLHPNMVGAVGPTSGEPPPRCTGDYC